MTFALPSQQFFVRFKINHRVQCPRIIRDPGRSTNMLDAAYVGAGQGVFTFLRAKVNLAPKTYSSGMTPSYRRRVADGSLVGQTTLSAIPIL